MPSSLSGGEARPFLTWCGGGEGEAGAPSSSLPSLPSGLLLVVGSRGGQAMGREARGSGEAGPGERRGEKMGEFASWLMEEQWERQVTWGPWHPGAPTSTRVSRALTEKPVCSFGT